MKKALLLIVFICILCIIVTVLFAALLRPQSFSMKDSIRLSISPGRFFFQKGLQKIEVKKYEEAIKFFKKAERIDPWIRKITIPMYVFIALGYMDEQKYINAINILNEVLKIEPYNSEAYLSLGICYEKLNLEEKAVRIWKDYIKMFPSNKYTPKIKYKLWKINKKLGYKKRIEQNID